MDKYIKDLEKIIKNLEEIDNNNNNITAILDLEDLKSLMNLLTRYKQLEEENRTLKRANSMAEDINIEDITQVMNKAYKDFMKEFIPKSLVKEKIEKLDNVDNAEALEDLMNRQNYTITELVQFVLREILKEKNSD